MPTRFSPVARCRQAVALALVAASGMAGLSGCHRAPSAWPVAIEISHLSASEPLQLGSPLKTAAGDEITVDELRYYLSNIRLHRGDGSWFANPQTADRPDGYFLVNEAVPTSKRLTIGPVPDGDYDGLEFLIGVDDARNHAGAQTGALDPANGMFWTWHTGYIFLKLEGHSPQSTSDAHAVSYHVGGGDIAAALSRSVYVSLPGVIHVNGSTATEIHLDADISALFAGTPRLHIADLSEAMEPPGTAQIADRFSGVFRVDHVHNLPRHGGGS